MLNYFILVWLFGTCVSVVYAENLILWGPCSAESLQEANAECGYLDVPMNYSDPSGKLIQIAVSRIRHNVTEDKYQGIILMNPGGPGDPGLELITRRSYLPKSVSDTYDWIGFDPRGVGYSQPSLSCMPNYNEGPRPDYVPHNAKEDRYWNNRAKAYAGACMKNHGELLAFMGTRYVAKDMDSIRAALNMEKINYIGYSYGSYLGQTYATLFPNRIRRMILDGVVDPRHVWFKVFTSHSYEFERNFNLWFNWLAKYNSSYNLGTTRFEVVQKWNQVFEELKQTPIDGKIGPSDWLDIFAFVANNQRVWPSMGATFANWYNNRTMQSKHKSVNQTVSEPSPDNGDAAFLSVIANDAPWPKNRYYVQQTSWWSYTKAPITAWRRSRMNLPLLYWPIKSNKRLRITNRSNRRILLIGAGLDAPTPVSGAFEVRKRFRRASLVMVENDPTHTTSLTGNTCVDTIVARYLGSNILPVRKVGSQADYICPGPPEPEPLARQ